jgi:hypothetical protein
MAKTGLMIPFIVVAVMVFTGVSVLVNTVLVILVIDLFASTR